MSCNWQLKIFFLNGTEGFLQSLKKKTHQQERNQNGILTIDLIFRTNDDHFNRPE